MEVTTASILVDFHTFRCGSCKVAMRDELAEKCPICGALFDRIASNHVGLADKLRKKREEAGVRLFIDVAANRPRTTSHQPKDDGSKMTTASILVDFHTIRCGNCKVALHDEFAAKCPICGALFDRIASNHVGLADKLRKKREEVGIEFA